MTHAKFVALQLKRGDVIEVRCGKEIRIFTCKDASHTGQTMVDAVNTEGKAYGIYFRDVLGKPDEHAASIAADGWEPDAERERRTR